MEVDCKNGGKADAFPLRVGVIQDGQEVLKTVLFPIGLETVLEANAHAISRTLVEHYFPATVAQRLEHRYQTFDAVKDDNVTAAGATMPYMVVDLLISRVLRGFGIAAFPRDLVLAVVDRVLSEASIRIIEVSPGATAAYADRFGGMLVDVLVGAKKEDLQRGVVSRSEAIDGAYKALLSELESGGDWQSIADDNSPLSSVRIWETYVAKHIMVPLLRARIASQGRAFTEHTEFLFLINQIGSPPVRVANGKLLFNLPKRVQAAWWHQLMLGAMLDDILFGEAAFCPRAFQRIPGIGEVNLAFEDTCQDNLHWGCGTYRPAESVDDLPNCMFEDALKISALERS